MIGVRFQIKKLFTDRGKNTYSKTIIHSFAQNLKLVYLFIFFFFSLFFLHVLTARPRSWKSTDVRFQITLYNSRHGDTTVYSCGRNVRIWYNHGIEHALHTEVTIRFILIRGLLQIISSTPGVIDYYIIVRNTVRKFKLNGIAVFGDPKVIFYKNN